MRKIYAGIGSRDTPEEAIVRLKQAGKYLAKKGFTLRSGGAKGADKAFEIGANAGGGKKEIYTVKSTNVDWEEAHKLAEQHHVIFNNLDPYIQRLMARNSFQVLGPYMNKPVDFVLCWTPDGAEHGSETTKGTGGTGQAIRIASAYNIPVLNLKKGDERFIEELKNFAAGRY